MDQNKPRKRRLSKANSPQERVVLLLDLDCFYAQCERIRLGFTGASDHETCCIALLQWDSCLAVSYPARACGIKRGDGFQAVHKKSKGNCMAMHVPILETGSTTDGTMTVDFDGNYETEYHLSPQEQQRMRQQDIGRRRYAHEGKACLERYRVASRKIFELVMECLGISNNNSSNSNGKANNSGVVLEKASIDEFFLDVTGACNNPDHSLWETLRKYHETHNNPSNEGNNQQYVHKSVIVGANGNNDTNYDEDDEFQSQNPLDSHPAMERGCQLAAYIRHYVFRELGFTLSAGISVNKMVAKLAASFGKPNGQAVVVPEHVSTVLQDTKLGKVRNFGGKLGKSIVELLPPEAPHTMGSVSKYLSLPQLQDKFSADTAQFIYQACRGHDNEAVQAKNSGNVVKSITAFKSLPRSLDADIEDANLVKWLHLLVQEVVSRVETDAQRNHRYPRNCTIQYGCQGQVTAAGKLDMKSFRIAFPPQRLSVMQRISQLMEKIPAKIIEREAPRRNKTTYRKRICLVRVGVCATEMLEEVQQNSSIANYFASAQQSPPKVAAKVEPSQPTTSSAPRGNEEDTDSQLLVKESRLRDDSTPCNGDRKVSSTSTETKPPETCKTQPEPGTVEDGDLRMARELQASFDREKNTLDALDKKLTSGSKQTSPKGNRIEDHSHSNAKCKSPPKAALATVADKDLEMAQKLQASYDREHSILGSWESRKGLLSNHGQPAPKKAKTRKISAFFEASK